MVSSPAVTPIYETVSLNLKLFSQFNFISRQIKHVANQLNFF